MYTKPGMYTEQGSHPLMKCPSSHWSSPSNTPSPLSFSSSPYNYPQLRLPTLLKAILHDFFLERKSVQQINEHFTNEGKFCVPRFIVGVVGATSAPLISLERTANELHEAMERIHERWRMLMFILELVQKGRSGEEIEGLCALNGYSTDKEFVRDLMLLEETHGC